jgi:hypothetical protein
MQLKINKVISEHDAHCLRSAAATTAGNVRLPPDRPSRAVKLRADDTSSEAASVPYRSVRGMLRNCLFPVQFPGCWDVDRHAEMDVVPVGGR